MARISGIEYRGSEIGNPSTFRYLSSHPLRQTADGQIGIGYWVELMECWDIGTNLSIIHFRSNVIFSLIRYFLPVYYFLLYNNHIT